MLIKEEIQVFHAEDSSGGRTNNAEVAAAARLKFFAAKSILEIEAGFVCILSWTVASTVAEAHYDFVKHASLCGLQASRERIFSCSSRHYFRAYFLPICFPIHLICITVLRRRTNAAVSGTTSMITHLFTARASTAFRPLSIDRGATANVAAAAAAAQIEA